MPPRGVKSAKRKRQYEHIKESAEKRGNPRAEEIAARTVNKQRARAGETKSGRGRKRKSSKKKSSGGRKSSSSGRRSSASSRKGTRKRSSKKR